jgi:hypothetical protein
MKLLLDNMVIQQGRFVDSKNTLDKDAMINMIRQSANYIISSKDSEITDMDIDHVLSEGEKRMKEMKNSLEQLDQSQLKML